MSGKGSEPLGKVAICSGHMIDKPGRPEPRFPREKEGAVRAAIARQLSAWGIGAGDLSICSGARGTDILFAEESLARGARVRLLLAKPVNDFVESSVRLEESDWVERFYALGERCDVATLPAPEDDEPALDVYARTNLWIIETARAAASASGAIHALLVWDEKSTGDGPGGTSDFAERVRRLGGAVAIINPTWL